MQEILLPLSRKDRIALLQSLWRKLKRMILACFCTALLPYVAVLAVMLLMQLIAGEAAKEGVDIGHYIPTNWEELNDFLVMSPIAGFIVYYALGIYLVVNILKNILPLLLDLICSKKRLLTFIPEPYRLAGCNDYFLRTPYRSELFATVTEAEYKLAEMGFEWELETACYSKLELSFAPLLTLKSQST